MPSQTAPKISCTPVHSCVQLPLYAPMNTSSSPVMTPKAVSSTVAMIPKAASKTGANRLQKPSQMALIVCVIDWKLIPIADSLS